MNFQVEPNPNAEYFLFDSFPKNFQKNSRRVFTFEYFGKMKKKKRPIIISNTYQTLKIN